MIKYVFSCKIELPELAFSCIHVINWRYQRILYKEFSCFFVWLNEAMIVNTCFNATDPNVGLALSADHATQKCYMADTGLLTTQTFMDGAYTDNELYKAILFDRLDINEGMILENAVAQMLRTMVISFIFIPAVIKKTGKITWKSTF